MWLLISQSMQHLVEKPSAVSVFQWIRLSREKWLLFEQSNDV